MAVLTPRVRTIGVRLSEDEYSSLEKFCIESGARSISDLARAAICSVVNRGNPNNAMASTENQNAAKVEEIQQRIEMLSAEIALLKAIAWKREKSRAGKGDVRLSELESPADKGKPDSDL